MPSPLDVIGGGKQSSTGGVCSEDVEIVSGHHVAPHAGIRPRPKAQIHRRNTVANHSRKGRVPIPNVQVVGICHDWHARLRFDQRIQFAGPFDTCQWLQERGIHNAEKDSGSTDSEGKGEDRSGAKALVHA